MIVRATTHQHRCATVRPDNIHSLVEYVNFLSISQQMHCVWVLSTDVWTNFLTDQMGNFLTNQMRNSYQSGFANVNLKAPWCQMSPEIHPRLPRNALLLRLGMHQIVTLRVFYDFIFVFHAQEICNSMWCRTRNGVEANIEPQAPK